MKLSKRLGHATAAVRNNTMHANSLYIMIAQGIMTVFGYGFWIITARLYTSEMVGLAGSLIAVATLITNISLLGFNNALIRFLPKAKNKSDLINTCLWVVVLASLLSAVLYLIGMKFFSPKLLFVTHEPLLLVMFLASMVLVAINTFTDSVFLAYRSTKYNIVIYGVYSILRVAAPLLLVSLGVMGIFAAHMLGIVAAVILSLYFMMTKLGWKPRLSISLPELKHMTVYSLANYAAGFLWSAPLLVAPIMVINHLGASQAAYFNMAMMIVNMLLIIPTAVTQSLFAEGSHAEEHKLMQLVKKSLLVGGGLTAIGIVGILALGKFAIGIFGHEYATGGAPLLYVMAATGLLVTANMVGNVILKVKKRIWTLVYINILGAVSTISLLPVFLTQGLVGVGYAYCIGQLLMALAYGSILTYKKLLTPKPAQVPARTEA
jgi:O-antigen/teichoic acid export membrane protein